MPHGRTPIEPVLFPFFFLYPDQSTLSAAFTFTHNVKVNLLFSFLDFRRKDYEPKYERKESTRNKHTTMEHRTRTRTARNSENWSRYGRAASISKNHMPLYAVCVNVCMYNSEICYHSHFDYIICTQKYLMAVWILMGQIIFLFFRFFFLWSKCFSRMQDQLVIAYLVMINAIIKW